MKVIATTALASAQWESFEGHMSWSLAMRPQYLINLHLISRYLLCQRIPDTEKEESSLRNAVQAITFTASSGGCPSCWTNAPCWLWRLYIYQPASFQLAFASYWTQAVTSILHCRSAEEIFSRVLVTVDFLFKTQTVNWIGILLSYFAWSTWLLWTYLRFRILRVLLFCEGF